MFLEFFHFPYSLVGLWINRALMSATVFSITLSLTLGQHAMHHYPRGDSTQATPAYIILLYANIFLLYAKMISTRPAQQALDHRIKRETEVREREVACNGQLARPWLGLNRQKLCGDQ
jgi:hypothetical protein